MTGAQASYLETLSREAGDEAPPADLTRAQASERIYALQQQTGRGAQRASLRRREAPHGHAEHHEAQDHDHARLEERGQAPAEPSKADQDATFTSLSWMIGASLA
jgi:hypothetical protein